MKTERRAAKPAVARASADAPRATIQLNDIALFVEVARRGSFSLSAAALGVPPSTLSRRVSGLERDLGMPLLKRSTRKIGLTEAGALYFERCRDLIDEARVAHEQLQAGIACPGGQLSVSLPASLAQVFMPTVIDAFHRRYPDIHCHFELGNQRVDPISSTCDIALRFGPQPSSSLIAHVISAMTPRLYASAAYLDRHGAPRTPADLARHQCLVGAPTGEFQWVLRSDTREERVQVSGKVAASDSGMIRSLVRAGVGVGPLLKFEAGEASGDRIVHVLERWSLPQVPLVALLPTRQAPARVRAFLDFIRPNLQEC
ncbi:D-malate degradation protein R [Achromobacter sp. 2789STDY5608615]|uniref:LysR family transcriptional regulator n=1 Tax=Achromobacter sp. 2789STDY5608615 TaxID=1806492 RepID=UPI0006C723AF|nr:LysR family transcriptional regulator [Achromobacter sp. 2789STDY5608615]CUK13033.1 D-malate degradation protein R [Achromobacter sp. 2789STDY5608615]